MALMSHECFYILLILQDKMEEANDSANEDGATPGLVAAILEPRGATLPSLPSSCISTSS